MPNTASGIRHIARSPGDHMQVEMKYCLPACRSMIEANVEPVGAMPRPDQAHRAANGRSDRRPFLLFQVAPIGHMPSRYNQEVACRNGIAIPKRKDEFICKDDARRID